MVNTMRFLAALTILIGLYFAIIGGQVSGLVFGLILIFNGLDSLIHANTTKRLQDYEGEKR